jgi:hypothetical protein
MTKGISEPMAYKKPVMSVGEEFVAWAEQYWDLENKLSGTNPNPDGKAIENSPYKAVRNIFIKKINDVISQRVTDYL